LVLAALKQLFQEFNSEYRGIFFNFACHLGKKKHASRLSTGTASEYPLPVSDFVRISR